ncbi:hypothetical protein DPM19_17570 [Actinomadura craniellae]|uniref:DUF1648 domain-containing protein n=1 Tax=Actinomadura craniellae TaxID=2231787 RepID=A0A365H741_9ACTN|nr:hypothetical protein [Actinomadura craniellae]RAY14083.1 hypothetical protein DPM19_17570 [Actinomadura craniellae]
MNNRARWSVGMLIIPGGALAGALAAALAWRSRLPDRLPGVGGDGPDATMAVAPFVATTLGLPAGLWVLGLVGFAVTTRLPASQAHAIRTGIQLAVTTVTLALTSAVIVVLHSALDAPSTEQASSPAPAVAVTAISAAALAGALVALALAGGRVTMPPAARAPDRSAVRLPLGAAERGTWQETRAIRPLRWAAALLVLAGAALTAVFVPLVGDVGWAMLAVAVTGLLLVPMHAYRLVIDQRTVRASYGPIRRTVAISDIVQAEAVTVEPNEWALAGMKGAGSSMLLAPGPALSLELADGTTFLTSCRDTATAAGFINSIRDRSA